jgi:hypothetical protein
MPAVVVTGERDAKFRALGVRLVAGLPEAELVVVPGAGHAVHLEAPRTRSRPPCPGPDPRHSRDASVMRVGAPPCRSAFGAQGSALLQAEAGPSGTRWPFETGSCGSSREEPEGRRPQEVGAACGERGGGVDRAAIRSARRASTSRRARLRWRGPSTRREQAGDAAQRLSFSATASAAPGGQRSRHGRGLVHWRRRTATRAADLGGAPSGRDGLLDQLQSRRRRAPRSPRSPPRPSTRRWRRGAAPSPARGGATAAIRPASSPVPTLTFTHS